MEDRQGSDGDRADPVRVGSERWRTPTPSFRVEPDVRGGPPEEPGRLNGEYPGISLSAANDGSGRRTGKTHGKRWGTAHEDGDRLTDLHSRNNMHCLCRSL